MLKLFSILAVIIALQGCVTSGKPGDQKIEFEKIIFHTSPCFGFCPIYHLEIDKDKNVKLYARLFYKEIPEDDRQIYINDREEDTLKMGYFRGKLSDSMFNKLMHELHTIGLDTFKFDTVLCCDGVVKTMIIYYNGKRKFIKTMFPPETMDNLMGILYGVCEENTLTKTRQKFEIEGWRDITEEPGS